MISKITIDKVFETALVEEVIEDFIQLKKQQMLPEKTTLTK